MLNLLHGTGYVADQDPAPNWKVDRMRKGVQEMMTEGNSHTISTVTTT